MKFSLLSLLLFVALASASWGKSAEDAVLEYFYLNAKAIKEGNPDLIETYIPEEGLILLDRTVPDQREVHVSKKQALQHQTTAITELLKTGMLYTVTQPTLIEVDGNTVMVEAQMLEIGLTEEKRTAAVVQIRSQYRFVDGNLQILRSELIDRKTFQLNEEAEAGTGQTATGPESKPEGGDKPQPESERSSR